MYEIYTNLSAKLTVNHIYESTTPIKFAQTNFSSERKKVVKGEGLVTAVLAELTNSHNKNQKPEAMRVLLDSGSDGDLIFFHEGTKMYIPFKENYAPQKWRMSNGVFTTTKVDNMEVLFLAFSSSKRFNFKPDVVIVPKSAPLPIYDLIIGIKSLANIGAMLNFAPYNLTLG